MKIKYSLLALSISCAGIQATSAEEVPGTLSFQPSIGIVKFDGDRNFDDGRILNADLGYQFDTNWGLQVGYGDFESETDAANLNVNGSIYRVNGIYSFDGTERLTPYGILGMGQFRNEVEGGKSDSDTTANIGAGIKYHLSERVAAITQVEAMRSLGDDENDWVASVGLSFVLNNPSKPVYTQTSTPEPVVDVMPVSAAPAVSSEKEVGIRLDVHFDFDKSIIKPIDESKIATVTKFLQDYPTTSLLIEGHTDSVASDTYNQRLSERRANAVRNALINNGVDGARLTAVGYGESRPIASNDTAEGRAENRRVLAEVNISVKE